MYLKLVLLRWQEFATRSVAVFFFDELLRCPWRWRISKYPSGVQARVVNEKQVDVPALRSVCSGCPEMR